MNPDCGNFIANGMGVRHEVESGGIRRKLGVAFGLTNG